MWPAICIAVQGGALPCSMSQACSTSVRAIDARYGGSSRISRLSMNDGHAAIVYPPSIMESGTMKPEMTKKIVTPR